MKKIRIFYKRKLEPKQKVEYDLQWYDPIKKEMQFFTGGKMEFEYRKDDYLEQIGQKNTFRMLPKIVDVFRNEEKHTNNKKDIIKFYLDYLNYNNSDISIDEDNAASVVFLVPDKELNDFVYELDNYRAEYLIS